MVTPTPLLVFHLPCFSFILPSLTPSPGCLWPVLLSWRHTETLSFWNPCSLLATEFFREALGTLDKSDLAGVSPISGHTTLHWCKCCKRGPHCLGTAVFESSGWQTRLAGNFLLSFSVLKVWKTALTPRNDFCLSVCRLWYFLSYSVLNPWRRSIYLHEKFLFAHMGPLKVTGLFSNWGWNM